MRLAIEFGGDGPGYGKIHQHGCRDLMDPETLTIGAGNYNIVDRGELVRAFNYTTGWESYSESEIFALLAPCARNVRDMEGRPFWNTSEDTAPKSVTDRLSFLGF